MPLPLYRFDTIPSSASSSGTFLSFTTSFPYLQISGKGMKASVFLVYPKYAYCTLASMCEASPVEEEKDAIRENQEVL
jgi:hypothetical protein